MKVRIIGGWSFLRGQTATVIQQGDSVTKVRLKSGVVEIIPNGHLEYTNDTKSLIH